MNRKERHRKVAGLSEEKQTYQDAVPLFAEFHQEKLSRKERIKKNRSKHERPSLEERKGQLKSGGHPNKNLNYRVNKNRHDFE